jgi:serine/threonine-protein kinase
MGTVYQGTDLKRNQPVAMKFLRPFLSDDIQFQQRFLKEAQAIQGLDHPNIIRVLHFTLPGQGPLFIVMEYINGGSLRDYQKWLYQQRRGMELGEAVHLTQQIAEALNYAHRVGMVHRDVITCCCACRMPIRPPSSKPF